MKRTKSSFGSSSTGSSIGSSSRNRPYVRQQRNLSRGDSVRGLAGAAGTRSTRAAVEQLEQRQLLFSLTVTPNDVDPATGIGTVQAFFGYTIPLLLPTDEVMQGDLEVEDEDFNDEDVGLPTQISSQHQFTDSGLRVIHNLTGTLDSFSLQPEDPMETDPDSAALLQARLRNIGDFFTFRVEDVPNVFTGVLNFQLDVFGSQGFPEEYMTVTLLLDGEVVQTYEGAAQINSRIVATGPNAARYNFVAQNFQAFDEIRFEITEVVPNNVVLDPFTMDNMVWTVPPDTFTEVTEGRIFGAEVILTGPVGATVQFLDLYGRDMVRTIRLGVPPQGRVPLVDTDLNGVPSFNDGIGRLNLTGFTEQTSLLMWGGVIEASEDPPQNATFVEGNFYYQRAANPTGIFDDFEEGGFGFVANTNRDIMGLPGGSGAVIIGSPFVRDNSSAFGYNIRNLAATPDQLNFTRADQGVFALGNQHVGQIHLNAVLHGSSLFEGVVDGFQTGYLVGSLTINGDAGYIMVASDAGLWFPDDENPPVPLDEFKTGSQIIVGRTVGELAIGGRSLVDVTVVGDLNSPATRPARDSLHYFEREVGLGSSSDTIGAWVEASSGYWLQTLMRETGLPTPRLVSAPIFGSSVVRNDALLSAEWVGSTASAVQIFGELGYGDGFQSEDVADVYGFASDGTVPIVVELEGFLPYPEILTRIVDNQGRTLAAGRLQDQILEQNRLEFMPTAPGVYYLVLTREPDNSIMTGMEYVVTITGLAPTTFGAYRTAAGSGLPDAFTQETNTVTLLSGSMGAVRVGTMYVNGGGAVTNPTEIINTRSSTAASAYAIFQAGTFTIPGNLYQIVTGGDLGNNSPDEFGSVVFEVGGNLAQIFTGLSTLGGIGGSPNQGDLNGFFLTVGGVIGTINISGGIGYDHVPSPPYNVALPNSISIETGTRGGPGHIAMIRVGAHVAGGTLLVRTSPNSIVGGFLVSQDVPTDPVDPDPNSGIFSATDSGASFQLGAGSDIRFVDFPQITVTASANATLPIIGGQALEFIDDAGARLRLTVSNVPAGVNVGHVRALPIDGSQGVAIAQIVVDLSLGGTLQLNTIGTTGASNIISIGSIIITGSVLTDGGGSAIRMSGDGEIDVYQILVGGAGLNSIRNETNNGDIVSISTPALNELRLRGSLGWTQVPSYGPALIGRFIGGPSGALLPVDAVSPSWNGGLYRPIGNGDMGSRYMDDIGGPYNPYLNGLLVTGTGNVSLISVNESVGNVYVTGNLLNLQVNADGVNTSGRFEGLTGVVLARNVILVDIGEGLAPNGQSPVANTGIFAVDDIHRVVGNNGAHIQAAIVAANFDPEDRGGVLDGVQEVSLRGGGSFIDSQVAAALLSDWWDAAVGPIEGLVFTGSVNDISTDTGNFYRSSILADEIVRVRIGGAFDASQISATNRVERIEAGEFRNTTLASTDREYREAFIEIGGDLESLIATGPRGISDISLGVVGSLLKGITAANLNRFDLRVNNQLSSIVVSGDVRASRITAGSFDLFSVAGAIRTSEVFVSGPLLQMGADVIETTSVAVTGPDGRIGTITARVRLSGQISASGPIGTISVTEGDMVAHIVTTTTAGNITLLTAGRDLDITTDVSGNIASLVAGRHIGSRANPGEILLKGNLTAVDVRNGQLYSDLRVGQDVTGVINIGRVSNKPGANLLGSGSIIAFGRINSVAILGDFGGNIISYSGGIGSVVITDGSFLAGGLVAAYDGDLGLFQINTGHLFGNVHADFLLARLILNGSGDFGDIGINPALSSSQSVGPFRNQLPPGMAPASAVQGPRITAGQNIGRIELTSGSIFEATIYAGHSIGNIIVSGGISNDGVTTGFGTHIAAGDVIVNVQIAGSVFNTAFAAGVKDFGADGRLGGTGVNADLIKAGRINTVVINGNARNVTFSAGINAGADGMYNTPDDFIALGLSYITNVTIGGTVDNVSAYADSGRTNATSGVLIGGRHLPVVGNLLEPFLVSDFSELGTVLTNGVAFSFTHGADTGTITFTGPGTAIWDSVGGRVILHNSRPTSSLVITSESGRLTNFDIVTNDDSMLGLLDIQADLFGDSDITIDGYLRTLTMGRFAGTGDIMVGMDILDATFVSMTGRSFTAVRIGQLTVSENLSSRIDMYGGATISVGGNLTGVVSMDRRLSGDLAVTGTVSKAAVRSAESIGSVTAGSVRESVFSAGNGFGPVQVSGNVFDSSFLAGADLGDDARSGGTGQNSDRVSAGSIQSVTVMGNFFESDVVAGGLRGSDGFFGTADDAIAAGRSNVGTVTIAGTGVGSNLGSESYRISGTGTIGMVRRAGQQITTVGNFSVTPLSTEPLPIRVSDLRVTQDSGVYVAQIYFNQRMDTTTFSESLSIFEVRGSAGQILTRLDEGLDYTLSYNTAQERLDITFNRNITSRDLPRVAGEPAPGIYRFTLDQDALRAAVAGARLDGDSDGVVEGEDNFSEDDIIGDAGDKAVAEQIIVTNQQTSQPHQVDAYGPINLDIVLDSNHDSDGIVDANRAFTLRGTMGDHPDNDTNTFRFSSDVDVYTITLQAGQVFRLGTITGAAFNVIRDLYNSDGELMGDPSSAAFFLPTALDPVTGLPTDSHYLVTETGTYYFVVAATIDNSEQFNVAGSVPNTGPTPGALGDYAFDIEIFDDGDTGFSASTDAGDGTALVRPPVASDFTGPDGMLNTADDFASIGIRGFNFGLDAGADGTKGTSDDVISASAGGISITRAGGVVTTTVDSAIGREDHAGIPGHVAPDVDIYHLYDRALLAPGSVVRVTVRMAEQGSNFGSRQAGDDLLGDFRGEVQMGLFETTGSTALNDGLLVFSPSDFLATAQDPQIIASGARATYGYDEDGNFFIEFITPGSMLSPDPANPQAASYAVYLQGVFSGNYQLEVQQKGVVALPTRESQNVFIETGGGFIDWLEAGGIETELAPFSAQALGFAGLINGITPVETYILNTLVDNLNQLFAAAGVNVVFSTNPVDFEFDDFSTVFLTTTPNPISFFNDEVYGVSEHSDPFNANRNDEAAVFTSAFSTLGYTPSEADVELFTDSLTASVARRVGELLGLRATAIDDPADLIDPMAANSVRVTPTNNGSYRFPTTPRPLSTSLDFLTSTDFYLGMSSADSLLDAVLAPQ